METPDIPGYEILAEIGAGAAGVVYAARHENGALCAIKVFDSMSSNAHLLASRVGRLTEGGFVNATVPIFGHALDSRPAYLVMSLVAEGDFRPRNLETELGGYLATEESWPLILKIASKLAALHTAKVAHGNLKPGNVFLDENGEPLLSDFASGLMPGIHRLDFTDALLYAPPEQLREPEGYQEEAGYRWDVFAFGVLAYRLLTGFFPRCHEAFEPISPAPGIDERFEIQADPEGIASHLEQNAAFVWPAEPVDDREVRRRRVFDSCLSLDRAARPVDMVEVSRQLEKIESDFAAQVEKDELVRLREKADRKRRSASRRFALASLVALGLGGGWYATQNIRYIEKIHARQEFGAFKTQSELEINDLKSQRDQAIEDEGIAQKAKTEIESLLAQEQDKAKDELISAQETNERLLDWILEEGIDGLPALEKRGDRLKLLAGKIDEQLAGMALRPALESQSAVLRLRRAEISLAMGEVETGGEKLAEAIEAGGLSDVLAMRARLRLLLLRSQKDPVNLEAMVSAAEEALPKAWPDDPSRTLRAKAAVELAKGRMWEAKSDGEKALASYLASLGHFKELEKKHPGIAMISHMVGRRYLSAATAAEGEGSFDNAAKLRAQAAAAFTALAEKQKKPAPELQYQIASATAARAVSMWQQGDTFGAEKLARQGVAKLTVLQAKLPDDFQVVIDLVSQQGIIATALRDEGKPKEARILLNRGIELLEDGIARKPKSWRARYLLASIKWQLSGIMGQEGESESELEMGEAARVELKALLSSGMTRPDPSEVRKSLAYLCGDLGHSADLRDKRELAVKYLKESQRSWQILARDNGDQLEYREGYHWAKNRLAEMGVE